MAAMNGRQVHLKRIFRASVNGWNAADFHTSCDTLYDTFLLAPTTDKVVFGGFTDCTWSSPNFGHYINCVTMKSFLCQLKPNITKFEQLQDKEKNTICCGKNYGHSFGAGYDLYISSKANATDS